MGKGRPDIWLLARVELSREQEPASLRRALRRAMVEADVPVEIINDVLLAAQEACNNALTHAATSETPPRLSVCLVNDYLVVEVSDRGGGFDVGAVQAGWPPELLEGHGRGLYLIDALTDTWEIVQGPKGTIVRMVKKVR